MAKLKLTVAFDKYDYLQPLRDGTVEAQGIDLNLITVESGIRHERMFHYGEYDACEFSMSSYLVATAEDVDWLHAIPFFPRRMFTHKFCFIAGSGIKKPADFKGGRIGLRSYENTLALITKGMFNNSYDLGVTDVTWVIINKEPVGFKLPPPSKSNRSKVSGARRSLVAREGRCGGGAGPAAALDSRRRHRRAVVSGVRAGRTRLLQKDRHLSDHASDGYQDGNPQERSLGRHQPLRSLHASRHAYDEFMEQPHRLSFAWGRSYLEEERKFFGKDPFYQGLKENYHDVQSMIKFADQQGMLARPLTVEEFFTENTRNT